MIVNRWILPLALVAAALGAVFGMGLFMRSSEEHGVELSPRVVEFAEDPFEGQSVTVRLKLTNESEQAVTVIGAHGSCGCMDLVTRGGKPLISPIDLPPGGTLPWEVRLDTAHRVGPQNFHVVVESRVKGKLVLSESIISMNIRSGWRARPGHVHVANAVVGKKHRQIIEVFDSFPGTGLQIGKVLVSNPRLSVEWSTVSGYPEVAVHSFHAHGVRLKRRYQLRLTFVPRSSDDFIVDESITLISSDSSHRLKLPVVYHLGTPEYRVSPKQVVLARAEAKHGLRRTLRCQFAKAATDLRVLRSPKWLFVTVNCDQPSKTATIVIETKFGKNDKIQ